MRRPRPPVPAAPAGVLLAVGSAQGADAITFVRMIRDHGLAAEGNPFVAALAEAGDLAPLLLLKALVVVLVVAVVVLLARRHVVAGAFVATCGVVAGLIGAWSNVVVIAGGVHRLLPT